MKRRGRWRDGYWIAVGLMLLGALLEAGCTSSGRTAPPQAGASSAALDVSQEPGSDTRAMLIGTSVEGRPITCRVLGIGSRTILIMASIHGNEPAGTPLLEALHEHLRKNTELLRGRRVLLLPRANPDGLARHTRTNARGVDVNRNFPAANWRSSRRNGAAPLSEPEGRALHALIERHRPACIVSIHQPLACIDYDGPCSGLARAMAHACRLPVRTLGARSGSLGSYAGVTLGIPIITVELPAGASRLNGLQLWDRYGEMLLTAIRWTDEE